MLNNSDGLSGAQIAQIWATMGLAALSGLCGRLAYRLFGIGEMPPADHEAYLAWRRRRWWMVFSEIGALPAFATGWTAAGLYLKFPMALVVLGSMLSGALGFGFLLHLLQFFVRERAAIATGVPFEIPPAERASSDV